MSATPSLVSLDSDDSHFSGSTVSLDLNEEPGSATVSPSGNSGDKSDHESDSSSGDFDSGAFGSFAFRVLPTELKLNIIKEAKYFANTCGPETLHELCFEKLPALKHTESNGRTFEVTVKDILRWHFKEETAIFPKQYVLDHLFPDGTLGFDEKGEDWWDVRGQLITGSIAQYDTLGGQRAPNGTDLETVEDYYQLRYIFLMQFWECNLVGELGSKFGYDFEQDLPKEWRFDNTWLHLCRFLGTFNTSLETNLERIQGRYDYLATLTIGQRKGIDALLNGFVGLYVKKFWDEPPQKSHKFYDVYHHISSAHRDRDDNHMLTVDFEWRQFTRSGAYALCLKHLFLSISDLSLLNLLCLSDSSDDMDDFLDANLDETWYLQMWEEEIHRTRTRNKRSKNMLVAEAPVDFSGQPTGIITLKSQVGLDGEMSMRRFVQLNPLWAWQQALELPVGQPLDVSGLRPSGANTGMFAIDRYADTHPEWDLDCFGDDDFELASFFGDALVIS